MKNIKKIALGALMLAGTAVGLSQPASAGVSVGIGIGIPGPAYYGPAYACEPYYDSYDPYGCGAYYSGPVFIDGVWFNGPLRWRAWGGGRQFWWHGGWHNGTGWHPGGFHGGHGPTVGHFGGTSHFGGHPTVGHFGGTSHFAGHPTVGHFGGSAGGHHR